MSEITAAFAELLDAQEDATGKRPAITIGSDAVECILGSDAQDPAFYGGGVASSGQLTCQTLYSAWTTLPAKGDSAVISETPSGDNITIQVLFTTERHGILYIELGDNSA